jgi:transcriptional regulator with XRE-family HTH domain
MKAARALLGWSQSDLARESGVSEATVKRLEAAEGEIGGRTGTGEKLRNTLEAAGVEFIPENGEGAGVRLRTRSHGGAPVGPDKLADVLASFAASRLPKAAEQAGVGNLRFVIAGSQATLMEGDNTLGMISVRAHEVVFSPALPQGRSSDGATITENDLWNWVITAWQQARNS